MLSITSICCGFVVQLVHALVQQLTRFRLTARRCVPTDTDTFNIANNYDRSPGDRVWAYTVMQVATCL